MNTTLTPEQIAAYRRDGFLIQRAFLKSAEVAELKAAVLESVASMGRKKITSGGADIEEREGEGEGYYTGVFLQRLNLWRISPVVKRYMLGREVGKMICDLEDVPGFRIWHDQTLIKEPFGNPTSWHLDVPYWSFHSRHAISIWIALEDATLENGCMWFIPGSQAISRYDNVGIGANMSGLFKIYPEMARIDPVAAPMKAGDCSFHNGLTAHAAGANMTRGRRIAMTAGYMPVGSQFNCKQNVLSAEYFKSLKEGDVLANDEWNPVVYAQ